MSAQFSMKKCEYSLIRLENKRNERKMKKGYDIFHTQPCVRM